ncbi:hypothetical protein Tcan_12401 [Toxocara canis]|uniref:Uncharacterized protein n=1 Tax=Toxocara canis TaxID=6265 RepID=A0A0B2VSS5_TOXCA|nr:hypothetical protein Tcan_12401 [Toxocara canis]
MSVAPLIARVDKRTRAHNAAAFHLTVRVRWAVSHDRVLCARPAATALHCRPANRQQVDQSNFEDCHIERTVKPRGGGDVYSEDERWRGPSFQGRLNSGASKDCADPMSREKGLTLRTPSTRIF